MVIGWPIAIVAGIVIATTACDRKAEKAEKVHPPTDTTSASPLFAYACPAPRVDTSNWHNVDIDSFSFSIPPEYVEVITTRIDTYPGEEHRQSRSFEFGMSHFAVNWGPIAEAFPKGVAGMDDSECREVVDGHEAHILSGYGPDDVYWASATWRIARPGMFIVMGGSGLQVDEQRKLLALVRTFRFPGVSE